MAGFEETDEWLETDGLGGFASGTVAGERTRRYHALLLDATRPPAGRVVLVNGVQAWVDTPAGSHVLTPQRYVPGVLAGAAARCVAFDTAPWPTWRLALPEGDTLVVEFFVARDDGRAVLSWRLDGALPAVGARLLRVRPLLSGRDYHALHHENPAFDFTATVAGDTVRWRPYGGLPAIVARANGVYTHEPDWYRNFFYAREHERGMDDAEDLATPGVFSFDLARGPAVLILRAQEDEAAGTAGALAAGTAGRPSMASDAAGTPAACAERLAAAERKRRAAFPGRLERSADAYLVRRGTGNTLVAGYPWFTDWGRDTFIAMRGLLLATGRWDDAGAILAAWAPFVSEGMLPNRFPDDGGEPEYNSVDASLWFVVAVHEYLAAGHADASTATRLRAAVDAVVRGYAGGTRYGIAADADGLLRAGVPGMQLTWMDARVGDRVVTPRIGKPVEVQALWINALRIACQWDTRWEDLVARATQAFGARFTEPASGGLYDVIDADHVSGRIDARIRPNQIFAVGGLPFALLEGERARAVVEQVAAHLLTPIGLRTLASADPDYVGRYEGAPAQRDAAYHQGTVWPWLLGPYVEAWLRVRGGLRDAEDAGAARARFLAPLLASLDSAGLDHVTEVANGDAPHRLGGAPCQAWSLGELLRIRRMLANP